MQSPFYIASVLLLKLHGSVVSHMQVLATTLLSVHNIKYSFSGPLYSWKNLIVVVFEAVM